MKEFTQEKDLLHVVVVTRNSLQNKQELFMKKFTQVKNHMPVDFAVKNF